MEKALRITKLKEIKKGVPYASKDIYYRGASRKMNVYEIPLEYLIFNQYNGRIATFVKTHEKQYGPIDATTKDGKELIAEFLWKSKEPANKATLQDLEEKGQQEYGIVTADGIVIDGNRRFMLLERNASELNKATAYFKVVILEHNLQDNRREIMDLETRYQMGADDKVDYNPIQKYLKYKDLNEEGFNNSEIAKMMGEDVKEIESYARILAYMEEYLKKNGYSGMYRILEEQQLEAPFYDLERYLETYKNGRKRQDMDWEAQKDDYDDLKGIVFDYIRAGFPSLDIRDISNPAKDKGFFTKKDIWDSFVEQHFAEIDAIKDNERTLNSIREEYPNTSIAKLISARDKDFKKEVDAIFKRNINQRRRDLEDQNAKDRPIELLERALKTLESVDYKVEGFDHEDIKKLSHEIRKKAEFFIKVVDGKA